MMFDNTVKTEWIENDPRKMRLLEEVNFTDSLGKVWTAHKGLILNGADIPEPLWGKKVGSRKVGSPYVGFHRRPSVLHDEACDKRTEPHELVHRMFYDAMLCEGMDPQEAYDKYLAVKAFGPKWDDDGNDL